MIKSPHLKIFLLISYFICLVQITNAQNDNLEPMPGYFSSSQSETFYYPLVKKALFDSLGYNPDTRILVLPSFTNEYVVSIDTKNGITYLTYRIAKQQIWHNRKSKAFEYDQYKMAFDSSMARKIHELLFLATSKAQYPTGSKLIEDGTTYNFICFNIGVGIRSGKTKSTDGEKMKGLVEITDWLVNCAKKGEILNIDNMTIVINNLIDNFKLN
jgi:hypothetical protein